MENKWKIWICNMVMAALAIASIVTLCLGSFFEFKINVDTNEVAVLFKKVNKEMQKISSGEETSGGESEEKSDSLDLSFDDIHFDVNLNFSIGVKNSDLFKIIFLGDKGLTDFIKRQTYEFGNQITRQIKDILKSFFASISNSMVSYSEKELINQTKETLSSMGETVNDEEVKQMIKEKYDIGEEDFTKFNDDLTDFYDEVIENGYSAETMKTFFAENELIDKILEASAKEIIKQSGEEVNENSIKEKKDELKAEMLEKNFDESLFANFENSTAGAPIKIDVIGYSLITLVSGEFRLLENEQEYNEFIEEYSNNASSKLGGLKKALFWIGIVILVVCLAWLYLLIKIIVRFFTKKKTVSMFAPRLLGWIPHVIPIGLPNLLVKAPKILSLFLSFFSSGEEAKMVEEVYNYEMNLVNFKLTSLAWVSAAATVVLMIISFFYRKWRKGEKNGEINK